MANKAIISTATLNSIGQAIIDKGGATSPIYPKDMPNAIRSISGGGAGGNVPAGGIKDQVLTKKSNADFDLEWKMGGDMRHEEFDALKRVDDLNPENTGITQICSLLNQIKNLLKPSCIAIFVSLLSISAYSAYVETNKLVNLIGKSNVVTGVSFDGLLTGINTNGHPVSVSSGVAYIVLPDDESYLPRNPTISTPIHGHIYFCTNVTILSSIGQYLDDDYRDGISFRNMNEDESYILPDNSQIVTSNILNGVVTNYLPLTGGTVIGDTTITGKVEIATIVGEFPVVQESVVVFDENGISVDGNWGYTKTSVSEGGVKIDGWGSLTFDKTESSGVFDNILSIDSDNDGKFCFGRDMGGLLNISSTLTPDNTPVLTAKKAETDYPVITNAYTKTESDTNYLGLIEDANNKKTAVTIGSRISSDIPEWSSTTSYMQGLAVWKKENDTKKYYMCVARNPTVAGTFNTSEWKSYLIGPYSFVVGTNCWSGIHDYGMSEYCHSEGLQTYSEGIACHVEGERSIASGYYTHAEGIMTYAAGTSAHAEGIKGDATNHVTFVWNGNYAVKPGTQIIDRDATVRYGSHGNGTFNVNPKGGADGFWIGDSSLSTLVNSKIQSITNKVYATDKGDMTGKAGYNVKWAMIGSSRTIIVDHASEKINKIQFSGAWGGSRGYSAKLLAWVNNGQDPSDSSTTVCALSDNVATEVNKNLPIVFEFSTGIALPEGSRLIVSACDPSKTWNDVKNVTWSQIATTYPAGHGMRLLCGTVQDSECRTFEENKTEIIQKRCPDACFTIYGTCASRDDLKPLSGKSFGLSTQQEMAIAISNIIEKLGGSVTSMP